MRHTPLSVFPLQANKACKFLYSEIFRRHPGGKLFQTAIYGIGACGKGGEKSRSAPRRRQDLGFFYQVSGHLVSLLNLNVMPPCCEEA
jgi:hypothetical protein